jgi:hypothetical protein
MTEKEQTSSGGGKAPTSRSTATTYQEKCDCPECDCATVLDCITENCPCCDHDDA